MKQLGIWLLLALLSFGLLAGGYHLYLERNPHRLLVVVDVSAPMQPTWPAVPRLLKQLSTRRYTVFALATEKDWVHSWSAHLNIGRTRPSGRRDFARLSGPDNHLAKTGAVSVVFITDAHAELTQPFKDWQIVQP